MKPKTGNLSCRLLASMMLLSLIWPLQAIASGVEARRAYVTGKHLLALELAQPAAERGDSIAMLVLGSLYFNGEGVRQDYATALKWWRAAAALGNIRAQNNIGVIFRRGRGVETNYNEAIKWFETAAAQDEDFAYYNLGLMHERGEGFSVDIQQAVNFYHKSEFLFRKELISEPENKRNIDRMLFDLTHRIRWLTSLLARPNAITPMPSTTQSSSGQQATPQ